VTPTPPQATDGPIVIGANGHNSNDPYHPSDDPFYGRIDEARVCSVALQARDVCVLAGRQWDALSATCQ
jgi:hypothetical protein